MSGCPRAVLGSAAGETRTRDLFLSQLRGTRTVIDVTDEVMHRTHKFNTTVVDNLIAFLLLSNLTTNLLSLAGFYMIQAWNDFFRQFCRRQPFIGSPCRPRVPTSHRHQLPVRPIFKRIFESNLPSSHHCHAACPFHISRCRKLFSSIRFTTHLPTTLFVVIPVCRTHEVTLTHFCLQ